jgi:hypothetical protein
MWELAPEQFILYHQSKGLMLITKAFNLKQLWVSNQKITTISYLVCVSQYLPLKLSLSVTIQLGKVE